MNARSRVLLPLVAATALATSAAEAAVVMTFSANFDDGTVGAEWSSPTPGWTLAVDTTPSGEKFLGLDDGSDAGLDNGTVQLRISGLPSYSGFSLSYDLFVIRSWDGNGPAFGPDLFLATVSNASLNQPLLTTTFSNVDASTQSYPGNYYGEVGAYVGAVNTDTLGYTNDGWLGVADATYSLGSAWGFGATDSDLILTFTVIGLQGLADESWGIDNLVIEFNEGFGGGGGGGGGGTEIPVPPAAALFASALGLLALRRRAG